MGYLDTSLVCFVQLGTMKFGVLILTWENLGPRLLTCNPMYKLSTIFEG